MRGVHVNSWYIVILCYQVKLGKQISVINHAGRRDWVVGWLRSGFKPQLCYL